MKFNEIPYSRPAIEKFEADFTQLLTSFNSAKDFKSQQTAFKALYNAVYPAASGTVVSFVV